METTPSEEHRQETTESFASEVQKESQTRSVISTARGSHGGGGGGGGGGGALAIIPKRLGSNSSKVHPSSQPSGTGVDKQLVVNSWSIDEKQKGREGNSMVLSGTAKVAPSSTAGTDRPKSGRDSSETTKNVRANPAGSIKVTPFASKYPILVKTVKMMDGKYWNALVMGVTLYALFGDDIRVAFFPMGVDDLFYTLSLLGMLLFMFELAVFTMCKPGYYKSFYFWLDILATVTMVTDVGFIWEPFMDTLLSTGNGTGNQEAIDAIHGTRAAKSSRVVRVVRLVRLVRLAKLLYKVRKSDGDMEDTMEEENPSMVGRKLSDKTMQRVIAVVLSMLIFVQFFDYGMYSGEAARGTYGLWVLHKAIQLQQPTKETLPANWTSWMDSTFKESIQDYTKGIEDQQLIHIKFHGLSDDENDQVIGYAKQTKFFDAEGEMVSTNPVNDYTPDTALKKSLESVNVDFRDTEYSIASVDSCYSVQPDTGLMVMNVTTGCASFAYFDISTSVRIAAVLNILQTLFVMVVLTFGSIMLSADAEVLVIRPIEKMVQSVKMLAENPMGTTGDVSAVENNGEEADETVLLQRTIAKIGQLLQIGFGEAGSEIIAKNMANGGGIEPMCDGVKMEAVFGFCDIRNFTDTTECLQEKVMVYVNKVGAIVHGATHEWYGAANKNIGDAFLLVWKINNNKKSSQPVAGNLCDNALVAFLRSIIDLKRENGPGGCLHEYKEHPAIRKRFGEDNFEIKLGMGLHIGWAIEGTIGSKYKIDASYLSPNVNMAARLEAATKQFRTPLLLSEDFYDGLSSKARKRCRQIDKVTVKGSLQPMGLFTCDIIDYPESFGIPEYNEEGERVKFDFDGPVMESIQAGLPDNFLDKFNKAIAFYLSGEWTECKEALDQILKEKPEDGPTVSLMLVMESYGWKAPAEWKGFRELTEK